MTPEVKEQNQEFAKWFGEWIAVAQRSRASVESTFSKSNAEVSIYDQEDCLTDHVLCNNITPVCRQVIGPFSRVDGSSQNDTQ